MKRLRSRKNAYLANRISELDDADFDTLARAADILELLVETEARS
jgi:hypothetical protein